MGDIDKNLAVMKEEEEPTEEITKKSWELLPMDWNLRELKKGILLLLLQVCWSTLTSDQQRALVSLLKRHHPDYELNTLLSRTQVYKNNISRMVVEPSQHDIRY